MAKNCLRPESASLIKLYWCRVCRILISNCEVFHISSSHYEYCGRRRFSSRCSRRRRYPFTPEETFEA